MRLDGFSYQEIADKFGVSRQRVQQIIPNVGRTCTSTSEKCIYEGLSHYLSKNRITAKKLADVVGIRYATMMGKLKGEHPFNIVEIEKILEFTGMKYEDLFKKKDIQAKQ